jgi:DNA-directed RNA polymerase subunit E'/Rpb7
MFVLSVLEDNVRVDPQDLGRPSSEAIAAVIEKTYLGMLSLVSDHLIVFR